MNRKEKFNSLKGHPMISRDFLRLTNAETKEIECFLDSTETLSDEEFLEKANRFKIDEKKTKNYTTQWAILIQCVEPKLRRRRE